MTVQVAVEELLAAVIVTGVEAFTASVVRVTEAVVAPAGIVTAAGTTTSAEELLRVTTNPLGPALPSIVTVSTVVLPPTTGLGVAVTLVKDAGLIINVVSVRVEPDTAVMTAVRGVETGLVVTARVYIVWNAATVIEDGI